jgi:hypothetical protein
MLTRRRIEWLNGFFISSPMQYLRLIGRLIKVGARVFYHANRRRLH